MNVDKSEITSAITLPSKDGALEDRENIPAKLGSASDQEADSEGKRQHELTNGNPWEDALDHVLREILHAATSA